MKQDIADLIQSADGLRHAGRYDEAAAAYRTLLEREPDLPDCWYNLGWVQKQARHYDQSLESYQRALDHGVSSPEEVHLNRAVILSDHLARPAEARTELETALAINPTYLPALLNLGNLHEDHGNRQEAAAAYRRALDVAPDDSLALSRLAGLTGAHTSDEVAAQVVAALEAAEHPAERADLGFALGRLLDARGAYGEAFDAYRAANEASRESFNPGHPGYDRGSVERVVDRLIAAFPEPVEASDGEGPAIFICGLFRSGSTLTEQILAGHSGIVPGGELDLIPELASRIHFYPEAASRPDEATAAMWRDFYSAGLAPFARDGARVTDKRPDNFLHIGLIKTLYPGARIVHTRRNRLDNLLSLYFLHLGPVMPYALDLSDADHWHGQYRRLMAHWKSIYPDDIFDVDYDVLVREPAGVVKPLIDFLGLDWEDGLLDFHERDGPVKTASVWQVRERLHARSSGRWRNYESQLKAALGDRFAES